MSFETGLSGLSASSQMLDVIGNNIANANTVGNKSSRVEFADIVASTIGTGGGGAGQGIGVTTAAVSEQFTQGNLTVTNNNMDLAINGNGFFQITRSDGTIAYTRNGQFKLDKDGNVITDDGSNVMGYPTDATGAPTSITPQKLVIPTTAPIAASATTTITAGLIWTPAPHRPARTRPSRPARLTEPQSRCMTRKAIRSQRACISPSSTPAPPRPKARCPRLPRQPTNGQFMTR